LKRQKDKKQKIPYKQQKEDELVIFFLLFSP